MVLSRSLWIQHSLNQQKKCLALSSTIRGPNEGAAHMVTLDFQQLLEGSGGHSHSWCWVPCQREGDGLDSQNLPPVPDRSTKRDRNSINQQLKQTVLLLANEHPFSGKHVLLNWYFLLSSQELMKAISQMWFCEEALASFSPGMVKTRIKTNQPSKHLVDWKGVNRFKNVCERLSLQK